MFQRILVANRGEVALRVIRACRDLSVEVVAVFSEADRDAPYLKLADEAVCIGPANSAESYLNIPRLISAAEISNVQAIHPGYGFLSENAHFAEICRSCNIEFIGPPHEAMRRLGNKNEARKLAKENNVPVVPGSEGLIEDDAEALRLAHAMGFPVLIKAAAGGACASRAMTSACKPASTPPDRKPKKPSKTAAFTSKNTSSTHATSKCKSSAIATATWSISGSAIAPCNAAIKNWSRNRRPPIYRPKSVWKSAMPLFASRKRRVTTMREPASSWSIPRIA